MQHTCAVRIQFARAEKVVKVLAKVSAMVSTLVVVVLVDCYCSDPVTIYLLVDVLWYTVQSQVFTYEAL